MNLAEFRDEYRAFRIALAEAEQSATTTDDRINVTTRVYDRFGDLFTLDALRDLVRWLNESGMSTTEHDARTRLLRAQREFYTRARTAPLAGELTRCERVANVEWRGKQVGAYQAVFRYAGDEASNGARQDLISRASDRLHACDDLRHELREAEQNAERTWDAELLIAPTIPAAQTTVSGTPAVLRADPVSPVNSASAKLLIGAEQFLEQTASLMREQAYKWQQSHLPETAFERQTFADARRFLRLPQADAYFPAGAQQNFYEDTLRSLHINPTRQPNVRVLLAEDETFVSECFATAPPADVRLRIDAKSGGVESFSRTLHAAGLAQHAAWVSADLASRYPEIVYPLREDDATTRASGELFASLMCDATFVGEHRHIELDAARVLVSEITSRELYTVRRLCALLVAEVDLSHDAQQIRQQSVTNRWATGLSEATFFRHDADVLLLEIERTRGHVANSLRARLFAVAWQERLRTRYGSAWWRSARARDELIDVWNTGTRHTVEELAAQLDAGELNFEQLAEDLTRTLIHARR